MSIYDLTEENRAVRERARSFAEEEILPHLARWEESEEFPYDVVRRMGEEGFYGACFPEEYGGSELGFLNLAIVCEEISRVSPGIGSTFNAQAMTVPFTILNWGTEEQIEKYVPPLIRGEKIGFFSLTEPGGGSDAAGSMKTRATREGARGYVLDGHKKWASLAGIAQACLDRAVKFCNERVVGGHRLGEYQMIQRLIADMRVEIEAARLLTYKSAYLKDRGEATTRESSHSKYFAAEALWNAAQALTEIYGGRALALDDEYPVSRYLSWANLFRTGEGPQNIQRILIAEDTLGFKDANRHNVKRRFSLKSDL